MHENQRKLKSTVFRCNENGDAFSNFRNVEALGKCHLVLAIEKCTRHVMAKGIYSPRRRLTKRVSCVLLCRVSGVDYKTDRN